MLLFEKDKENKERKIEKLTKELVEAKAQLRQEKKRLDDTEEEEDKLRVIRDKLLEELDILDDELDVLEGDDDSDDDNQEDDDDMLLEKLQQEAAYLERMLQSEDDQINKINLDLMRLSDKNQMCEHENVLLAKKFADCVPLDDEISQIQKELAVSIDQEKDLFDENLKLLNWLKMLELQEQENSRTKTQREQYVNCLVEQDKMERKSRDIDFKLKEYFSKLNFKTKFFELMKWKVEQSQLLICNDQELRRLTGLDTFKSKLDRFSLDLQQITQTKDKIMIAKKTMDDDIFIKEMKNASAETINQLSRKLADLEQDMDQMLQRENDLLDLEKLQKSYLEFERDTETEFMKRFKSIKSQEEEYQLMMLMRDKDFFDISKVEQLENKVKIFLYDIDEFDVQQELNINWHIAIMREGEQDYKKSTHDIKHFYQLQYINNFKKVMNKSEMRNKIQEKLKKIQDNVSLLDKTLQENSNALDQISKEGSYLKDSEFSPVKGRVSILYGVKGDLEKEKELAIQNKQIEQQLQRFDSMKTERDKLKKLLKQYQQKFDEMDLENCNIIQMDELIDEVNTDLDVKTEDLRQQVKNQLRNELSQLQEQVNDRLDKFQEKRQLLGDCKQDEKDKRQEIGKYDALNNKLLGRLDKLEKDLKNQQGGLGNNNNEKALQLNQDLKDIQNLRRKADAIQREIDDQRQNVHIIAAELNMVGDKVITLDNLKSIQQQLQGLEKLKILQDQLKELGDEITAKEVQVEQSIKDMFGSSLFECEKKFKECEQLIEQLGKKCIDLNNGMNDFELEVKKGFHLYPNNEELLKEGQRLSDDNSIDRKEQKGIEDQKNMIRKVLHKIKNALGEQEQMKSKNLTAAVLEDFINEIDTCMQKGIMNLKDLDSLEDKLNKRKDQWNKLMFKGGAQEALIEDIEKSINDNQHNHNQLSNKVADIDKMIQSMEQVCKSMMDAPDYELRKNAVQKMLESIQDFKKEKDEIKKQMGTIQGNIDKLKNAKDKGLRDLTVEKLQELARVTEENGDQLQKELKKSEQVLQGLKKKRQKLGDADIFDNFKQRQESLNQIDLKLKTIEKDWQDLDKILQEAGKINPASANESIRKINQTQKDLDGIVKERNQIMEKLNNLRDQIKAKDLNRDDPVNFIPLINEMQSLKRALDSKDDQLLDISKQIKFLKNKHGGVDIEKKFEQFKLKSADMEKKMRDLYEDYEILRELQEDFDGYTSDNQEEDFIDRLGIEVKEMDAKYKMFNEVNEQIQEKVFIEQQNLGKQSEDSITGSDIEQRAQIISEIEEESYKLERMLEDVNRKIHRNKKVFMQMPAKDKLSRRELEIVELNKRLVQFENAVNEMDLDIQQELNMLKESGNYEPEQLKNLNDILQEVQQVKGDYYEPGAQLKLATNQLEQIKENVGNIHQYDLLKHNLKIKKGILNTLKQIKDIRVRFNQCKVNFINNRPVKQAAYKAIKGDYVDQLIADWINNNNCPVPISRLGNGFYMFGSKKIFAKIMNGKLLIRVGGGYMSIDEFMFYYGAQELNKMLAYEDFDDGEEIDLDHALDTEESKKDIIRNYGDGKAVIGSQQFKKRMSPRPPGTTSPRPGSPNGSSQSSRRSQQGIASPRNIGGQVSPRSKMGSAASRKSPRGGQGPSTMIGGSFLKQGAMRQDNDESMRRIESIKERRKQNQ